MDKRGISSEGILYISMVFIVVSIVAMNFELDDEITANVIREQCDKPFAIEESCKISCARANGNSCTKRCEDLCSKEFSSVD